MTCEPLAHTGVGQLGLLLTVGVGCLVAGGVLLLLSRRRGRAFTVVVLVLLVGATTSITAGTSAQAGTPDCPPAHNSITIVQTSVMNGLGPGIEPVAIAGIATNNATDSTEIVAIDVEITGVTTAAGSAPGTCDPSDYLLLDSRMPVGVTLVPGGSTAFAGAFIGFSNKSTNQDTCKGATVDLLYTAESPCGDGAPAAVNPDGTRATGGNAGSRIAYTGSGQLDLLLTVAIVCLIVGGALLLLSRRPGQGGHRVSTSWTNRVRRGDAQPARSANLE